MNYCFQKKEKYLRIFQTKDSIKQMNYLKKIGYGELKLIVNSSGIEINFSELEDPLAFLDNIKKGETSIEEAQHKQEEFNRYLKRSLEINLKDKKQPWLILISYLMKETMLLNLQMTTVQ